MRRSLVLTDESCRHPFRRSLPPHIRREPVGVPNLWQFTGSDVRGFASTYLAATAAIFVFIL